MPRGIGGVCKYCRTVELVACFGSRSVDVMYLEVALLGLVGCSALLSRTDCFLAGEADECFISCSVETCPDLKDMLLRLIGLMGLP